MEELRLFTALKVPAEISESLANLPHTLEKAKWLTPIDHHITLRYLGNVQRTHITDLTKRLSAIRKNKINIELQGLNLFNLKKQTILWASVASTRKITDLAAQINANIESLGFEMPTKPYTPHVTLARVPGFTPKIEEYISKYGRQIKANWKAHSFDLYESKENPENTNKYNILEEFQLN